MKDTGFASSPTTFRHALDSCKGLFRLFGLGWATLKACFAHRAGTVDNRSLSTLSLVASLAGIALIYGLSCAVEPKAISVNLLDRHLGNIVSVSGSIVDLRRHEAGHIFLKVRDESGVCEVPLFKDIASKMPRLILGDHLRVVGVVEEYRDALQVVPRTDLDISVIVDPPLPVGTARDRAGEIVKLRGIVYGIRELEEGQEMYLTDGRDSIRATSSLQQAFRLGQNVTVSGSVKTGEGGTYLAIREIVDISISGANPVNISELGGSRGPFIIVGLLTLSEEGGSVQDGTGSIPVDASVIAPGILEGDLVQALVVQRGDGMSVVDVEMERAGILPVGRLSTEMVGTIVRIRGTVVSRFVSGKNTFLTLFNGTEVEVPLFGIGADFNLQLGDVLTVSGKVGVYRDKLQVVPRDITTAEIEPGFIQEMNIDEITEKDIHSLVRTAGRISSIKRYSQSCSMWIKGQSQKLRVYLTFAPKGNLTVGTEIEAIGLVKSYQGDLELVPRGPEDLG